MVQVINTVTSQSIRDVVDNYVNYANYTRNIKFPSGAEMAPLLFAVDTQGGWASGISFLFSSPETKRFLNGDVFDAIEVIWCSNIDSGLQLADARWHDLDDSVPLGNLPKSDGVAVSQRIPLGQPHPIWGVTVGEDPRFVYSGSSEYGWIDRSRLASMFLRFPAPQKGYFELIELSFVKNDAPAALSPNTAKNCKQQS